MATQSELDAYKKYYESIGRPDLISSLSSMAVTPDAQAAPQNAPPPPSYYTPSYADSPTVVGPGGYSQPQNPSQFASEGMARDLAARTGAQGIVSGEWAPGGQFQQTVNPLELDYGGQDRHNAGLIGDLYSKYPPHVVDAILRQEMSRSGGSFGAVPTAQQGVKASNWADNIAPLSGPISPMSSIDFASRRPGLSGGAPGGAPGRTSPVRPSPQPAGPLPDVPPIGGGGPGGGTSPGRIPLRPRTASRPSPMSAVVNPSIPELISSIGQQSPQRATFNTSGEGSRISEMLRQQAAQRSQGRYF